MIIDTLRLRSYSKGWPRASGAFPMTFSPPTGSILEALPKASMRLKSTTGLSEKSAFTHNRNMPRHLSKAIFGK